MFHIHDVLQLKDDEIVKLVVRKHPVTLVPGLLAALVLIVTPFFFLFVLFDWGSPGVGLFFISVLGGIVLAIRAMMIWDADVLIVTTFRLVEVNQRGIFSRFVKELPLASVADATWHRSGLLDTIFRIGTLHLQGGEGVAKIEIESVSHPEQVHEMIGDLRHATTPQRLEVSPERRERLRILTKILESLEPEVYDRVESLVKRELREESPKPDEKVLA